MYLPPTNPGPHRCTQLGMYLFGMESYDKNCSLLSSNCSTSGRNKEWGVFRWNSRNIGILLLFLALGQWPIIPPKKGDVYITAKIILLCTATPAPVDTYLGRMPMYTNIHTVKLERVWNTNGSRNSRYIGLFLLPSCDSPFLSQVLSS